MKRILQLSLALNVMLFVVLTWRGSREQPMPRPTRGEIRQAIPGSPGVRVLSRTSRPQSATPWKKIEDNDPRKLIEKLRAIGCPEQTIRDIVVLRVCRDYRSRLLALEAEAAQAWDYTRQLSWIGGRERIRRQQGLRDEMINELESLFPESWQTLTASLRGGPEWGRDPLEALSVETRRRIREVDAQYRSELDELQQRRWTGNLGVEDLARLRELERQKRASLAGLLTPQELEEYLYRQSAAADYVRRNLPEAGSEGEFRTMVKLALDMEMSESGDALPSRSGVALPEDAKREIEQRKTEFDQRLKELLGEARLAEQQAEEQAREATERKEREAQDEQRVQQELTAMAAEIGVSAEAASRFFKRVKESESQLTSKFEEMEKKLTGPPEEKQKQMEAAIKAELEKIAVETMGEKGRAVVEKMIKSER